MGDDDKRWKRFPNEAPVETIITQYVPCAVSETGRHPVRAAIRENSQIAHLECECDQEMSDSVIRLGGTSCKQLVDKIRDGLTGRVSYYSISLPGALSGLSNSIRSAENRKQTQPGRGHRVEEEKKANDGGAVVATKWARRASGLRGHVEVRRWSSGSPTTIIVDGMTLAEFDGVKWTVERDRVREFALCRGSVGGRESKTCPLCDADVRTDGKADKHARRPKHVANVFAAVQRAVAILTPGDSHGGPSPSRIHRRSMARRAAWGYANRQGAK